MFVDVFPGLNLLLYVRPILFYTGYLPFNMLMDERLILLVKEWMNVYQ